MAEKNQTILSFFRMAFAAFGAELKLFDLATTGVDK